MSVASGNTDEPSLFRCFLHIGALNAFAVAQPVFDRVVSNPKYLRLEGYSGIAIAASLSIFLLAIPVGVTLCVAILRLLMHPRVGRAVFAGVGTVLVALVINIALRWLQWWFELRSAGVPDFLIAAMSCPLAIACAWMYRRSEWPRQTLSVAAIGMILFPMNLVSTPAMRAELFGIQVKKLDGLRADNPVPIVMIAFDGLCSMSLLNERHEIDAVRYPAFARLARQSTFHRNATSVHARTVHALPSILTGQLPRPDGVNALESEYPHNLFRLIYDSEQFDMTVFEPMTFLCPRELRQFDQTLSWPRQVSRLTDMLIRVYVATTVPSDMDSRQHKIPKAWFGIAEGDDLIHPLEKGLLTYGWDTGHDVQVAHFIRTLQPTEKPGFHFLHVVIPHDPWSFLPSGRSYLKQGGIAEPIPGTNGSSSERWGSDQLLVNLAWQRYLLQLQFADRCLGQILDRLEETDQFDRSLLVVVADHGMAFIAGQERRTPANDTLADLMSVPLFIKQPHQKAGEITDRNTETIDVVPTIADIIQMPLPGPVDGTSLVAKDSPERPRKTMRAGNDQTMVVNPEFSQRFGYVDRMLAGFGSGSSNDRLWDLHTIPELVGRQLTACRMETPSEWKCELSRGGEKTDPAVPGFVPCYFVGQLTGPDVLQPVQIAIALNGRIECTTRTSGDPSMPGAWTALLRDELFRSDANAVQLFEVERSEGSFILHPLLWH